jgi:hypothetical protein
MRWMSYEVDGNKGGEDGGQAASDSTPRKVVVENVGHDPKSHLV